MTKIIMNTFAFFIEYISGLCIFTENTFLFVFFEQ